MTEHKLCTKSCPVMDSSSGNQQEHTGANHLFLNDLYNTKKILFSLDPRKQCLSFWLRNSECNLNNNNLLGTFLIFYEGQDTAS